MATATIQELQAHLPPLLAELMPGEEVLIVKNGQPMATLIRQRRSGSAVGKLMIVADDDEHVKGFEEYMS